MGESRSKPNWLLLLGSVAFFVAACAYGMLEVHSSTDTWIGLAAGRQIVELGQVPRTDSFSFTFPDQPWFNQNWGTHLLQYWLFSHFGPDSVIFSHWATVLATIALIAFAGWRRTGLWAGALVTAGIAALGFRDYVSPRPATFGYLCMAALWAIHCTLEARQTKNRWIAIGLVVPILLFWGCVHGSFTFGYGLLGLYVISWAVTQAIRPAWNCVPLRQVAALVACVALAFVLTLGFGPFGLDNFTHGEKVASSLTFRSVSEWRPPTTPGIPFPPVWRFWLILAAMIAALIGAQALVGLARVWSDPLSDEKTRTKTASPIRITLFDFAPLLLGLAMTFWARRFAPIYLIFGAPIILACVLRITQGLKPAFRRGVGLAVGVAALVAAGAVGWETTRKAQAEILEPRTQYPGSSLLDRVTHHTQSPVEAIEFLKENELTPNIFVEWTQASAVMFVWPKARVFMDGRAQQLYDEQTYLRYVQIVLEYAQFASEEEARSIVLNALESAGDVATTVSPPPRVDAVLLRIGRAQPLNDALERSRDWAACFSNPESKLFLRVNSASFAALVRRIDEGREYWPKTAFGHFSRAKVLLRKQPPDGPAALDSFKRCVESDHAFAASALVGVYQLQVQLGRLDEARTYFQTQKTRYDQPIPGLDENDRRSILMQIENIQTAISKRAATTQPAAPLP